jgi:pilus assembly protein CpaB
LRVLDQDGYEGKPIAVQAVNLLVTPEQAERLSLASHQTSIQLALRNPLDRDVTKTSGVAQSQLFGGDKPKRAEPPTPPARLRRRRAGLPVVAEAPPSPPPPPIKKEEPSMEIILGDRKTEHKF